MLLVACDRCNGTGYVPSDSAAQFHIPSPGLSLLTTTKPLESHHAGRKRSRSLGPSHRIAIQGHSSAPFADSQDGHDDVEPGLRQEHLLSDECKNSANSNDNDKDKNFRGIELFNLPERSHTSLSRLVAPPSSSESHQSTNFPTSPPPLTTGPSSSSTTSTTSLLQNALGKRHNSDSSHVAGTSSASSSSTVPTTSSSSAPSSFRTTKTEARNDSQNDRQWHQYHHPKGSGSGTLSLEPDTSAASSGRGSSAASFEQQLQPSLLPPQADLQSGRATPSSMSVTSDVTAPLFSSHAHGENSPSSGPVASKPKLPPLKALLDGMNEWPQSKSSGKSSLASARDSNGGQTSLYNNGGRASPASRSYHYPSHSHSFSGTDGRFSPDVSQAALQIPDTSTPPVFMFTRDDPSVADQLSRANTSLMSSLNMAPGRGASLTSSQRVNAESNRTDSAASDSGSVEPAHNPKRPKLARETHGHAQEGSRQVMAIPIGLHKDASPGSMSSAARPNSARIISGNDVDFYLGMKNNAPQTMNDEMRVKQLDSLLNRNVVITPSLEKRGPELEAAIHLATIASGSGDRSIDDQPLYVTVAESNTDTRGRLLNPEHSGSDFSSYGTTPSLVAGTSSGGSTSAGQVGQLHATSSQDIRSAPVTEAQQESPPYMTWEHDPQEDGDDPRGLNGAGKYFCEICQKRFSRPSALAVHSHMHTGAKPFSCRVCQRSFSVNSNLRRHMKTHSKEERGDAIQ